MKIRVDNRPWITQEIIEDKSNRPFLIYKAKQKRTEIKRGIWRARAEYLKNELHKHKNNPRKFWVQMNKLVKNNKKQN